MTPNNPQPQTNFKSLISTVRTIAERRLRQLNRADDLVQESYLLASGNLAGVRYQSGPFRLTWQCDKDHATLTRGSLTIETIALIEPSVASDQRPRRAA